MTRKQIKKYNELMKLSAEELRDLRSKHWDAQEIAASTVPPDGLPIFNYSAREYLSHGIKIFGIIALCKTAKYAVDKIVEKI